MNAFPEVVGTTFFSDKATGRNQISNPALKPAVVAV